MTRPPLPAAFLQTPIAHRALHDAAQGRAENSPGAVAAAVAAGYGVEIDLQPSADGDAMVFHDRTLERMTDATGAVRARSTAELEQIALLGGRDTIPRLARILELVDGRVPLLIELKDQAHADGPGPLESATARALAGYSGPVAVMSFAPGAVAQCAKVAPDIARGLVTCAFDAAQAPGLAEPDRHALRDITAFDAVGASFISHDARDLDRSRVAQLRAEGWPVLCWTVTSATEEKAARRHADNITFESYLPALDRGRDGSTSA